MIDILDLEASIFTRVKVPLKKKFSYLTDSNFTTGEENRTAPKFPNIYVFLMPSSEIGMTLDGKVMAGCDCSVQIQVTDNQGQARVQDIMKEIVKIMKIYYFNLSGGGLPTYQNTKDRWWSVARFERKLGRDDIL